MIFLKHSFASVAREIASGLENGSITLDNRQGQSRSVSISSLIENFKSEVSNFQRIFPELLGTYEGRFVAIMGGVVIDCDSDQFALATRVSNFSRGRLVLVQRITRNEPQVIRIDTMGE